MSEQDRPDAAAARTARFEVQPDFDPRRLFLVDECATSSRMALIHGRAPWMSYPAHLSRTDTGRPHRSWGADLGGVAARWVIDGATYDEMLVPPVRSQVVPVLRSGDVVVLDNLQAHKPTSIREAIGTTGAPSYCCRSTVRTLSNRTRFLEAETRLRSQASRAEEAPNPTISAGSTALRHLAADKTSLQVPMNQKDGRLN